MQKLQETKEKLFQEIKDLIQLISEFSNEDEILNKIPLVNELNEKLVSLKNYKEINDIISAEEFSSQNTERQVINFEIDTKKIEDNDVPTQITEEINTDLEDAAEEISVEENIVSEKIDEEYFREREELQKELSENIEKEKEEEIFEITSDKEEIEKKEEQVRLHEQRIKILEIDKPTHEHQENLQELKEEIHEDRKEHHERKFKLANIKGLKSTVQSLFDDDPLEKIEKTHEILKTQEVEKPTQSLEKTNVSTDYMEAEKTLPDFKLDINDRLAFTKMLFEGSQVELNHVINKLNSYKTLEEAKEYLSEVYYERKWEKADEYAQRLWSLVENKFI